MPIRLLAECFVFGKVCCCYCLRLENNILAMDLRLQGISGSSSCGAFSLENSAARSNWCDAGRKE